MSKNIQQIYLANPITTNASTDLMYFGQSPYGAGNDAAMTFANFNAQIVANGTANQIGYYATTGNKISPITNAINGVLITSNAGIPSWLANSVTPGFVLTANSGAPPSWQAVSASGAITTINGNSGSATPSSGIVTINGGTTGLTTSGSGSTLSLTGTLSVANGGTSLATTPTNGQLLIGNATNYTLATLTAGTGVSVSNGSGSITISATGGGLATTPVAGTTQAMVANTQYLFNNAAATTGTLPTTGTSTIGDVIKVKGASAAPFIIQANTGQTITYGATASSVAGTATSNAGTDSIQLVYVSANTWSVDWALSAGFVLA